MDFILQISKKKSVTVWKKIGTLTFPFLFLIQSAFESVCDYFELSTKSDVMWMLIFVTFCVFTWMFCIVINMFN
ncbi:hypothetical protein NRS6132_21190 (plasmid) [Bacillus subtilis]|nr:hypothetical protein NRS6132_04030 [Bacillus subtilis]CAI6329666.1 hypothetical protein NRS6132_21190 [Bacillus subtilis]